MYLTEQEHEAFMRGRAAGLIPEDYPLPSCDKGTIRSRRATRRLTN